MRYGKIALKILAVFGATIALMFVLRPGWGSPLRALVGPVILLTPPLSLGFGVAGLSRDSNKLPAIVALLISGAFIAYFLMATGILFRTHWQADCGKSCLFV